MKKVLIALFLVISLFLCSCSQDSPLEETLAGINVSLNEKYLYKTKVINKISYIDANGEKVLDFEYDEELPKIVLKENGFIRYQNENYKLVDGKLVKIDKRYYPQILNGAIYYYTDDNNNFYDLNYKHLKEFDNDQIWRSLGPGILTISNDHKESHLIGINGKKIYKDTIHNTIGPNPQMVYVNANTISVVLNNEVKELVLIAKNNNVEIYDYELNELGTVKNISNVNDISLEFDSYGNTTGIYFINNVRFDLNDKTSNNADVCKEIVFPNGNYFTKSKINLEKKGIFDGVYWQANNKFYAKYNSSNNVNVVVLNRSGEIVKEEVFAEKAGTKYYYSNDYITGNIIQSESEAYSYTIDGTTYKLSNSSHYKMFNDGDIVVYDDKIGVIILGNNVKVINNNPDYQICKLDLGNRYYMIIGKELICCDSVNDKITTYQLDGNGYSISNHTALDGNNLFVTSKEKTLCLDVTDLDSIKLKLSFDGEIAWS